MGEFTQNLLKLTEFPFSYSLIGLIALMTGQSIGVDLSFAKIGPLLILMGFVATTLSICDPMGAIQRRIIGGRSEFWSELKGERITIWTSFISATPMLLKEIFGEPLGSFGLTYIVSVGFTPISARDLDIDWVKVQKEVKDQISSPGYDQEDKIDGRVASRIYNLLEGLKQQTVATKWITAEIDRITALIYFIIIILLFISATLFIQNFLPKFAQPFGQTDITKIIIFAFSTVACIVVILMFVIRIRRLKKKALIVFRYLTAFEAIKVSKENYETILANIERYLDDNHWTLAQYWVNHIEDEYVKVFLNEVTKEKKSKKELRGGSMQWYLQKI